MVNAAVFILTQCNDVRKVYLKTSLYYLFKNFNEKYKYPVIIFHEGDYDTKSQEEIYKSVRQSCRHLVSFRQLDDGDFTVPKHIDMEKAERCINLKCTPYWRNLPYRNMCRWWIVHMPRYAAAYDYVMRIDDDLFIEEEINVDMIAEAAETNKVYISNMIHVDCAICCYGFKEILCRYFSDKVPYIEELFQKQEIPSRAYQLTGLRSLLSIAPIAEGPVGEKITLWSPVMNYNNFHITASAFWMRPEVQKLIDYIDKSGLIYYYRLGDSPIQSAITMLLAQPEELGRIKFRYSKRLQRECHHGDDNVIHSYMPGDYTKTSDITETNN
jgi:alpha 1,2-mannosyltransferase